MTTVLKVGATSTDLVAIEARKELGNAAAEPKDDPADDPLDRDGDDGGAEDTAADGAKVISLHTERLPPDLRPGLPDMSKYDRLLKPVAATTSTATTPKKGHQRMTPTATAEQHAVEVPATRMPLPGDPEDTAVDELCRDLGLPALRERFIEVAATARREQVTCKQFLPDLLQLEREDRELCRQQRLIRAAGFPAPSGWRTSGSRRPPTSHSRSSAS